MGRKFTNDEIHDTSHTTVYQANNLLNFNTHKLNYKKQPTPNNRP